MTGVQTCALPICFPVTIGAVRRPMGLEVYDINGTLWQVNELKPNGDFIAGCHKVAWKDIEGFATRQGWLKDGVVFKAELV